MCWSPFLIVSVEAIFFHHVTSHNSPLWSYSHLIELYFIALVEGTISLSACCEITVIREWLFVFTCRGSEKGWNGAGTSTEETSFFRRTLLASHFLSGDPCSAQRLTVMRSRMKMDGLDSSSSSHLLAGFCTLPTSNCSLWRSGFPDTDFQLQQ